jgi:hypothetical protein
MMRVLKLTPSDLHGRCRDAGSYLTWRCMSAVSSLGLKQAIQLPTPHSGF